VLERSLTRPWRVHYTELSSNIYQITDIYSRIREESPKHSALAPNIFQRAVDDGYMNLSYAQYYQRELFVLNQRNLPTSTRCGKIWASVALMPSHSTKQGH
jgi:hypothetical protein